LRDCGQEKRAIASFWNNNAFRAEDSHRVIGSDTGGDLPLESRKLLPKRRWTSTFIMVIVRDGLDESETKLSAEKI
jgi:hypothetical protein